MDHWVEFPPEPSELTLAWRAPESVEDRKRWAVGMLNSRGAHATFRYLEGEEFRAANSGRDMSTLTALGYRGYPTFELRRNNGAVFSEGALQAFLRRLPPPNRPDFPKYLELFHYRGQTLPPMSLLALTSARLPSDGFSLIDRLDPASTACDLVVEIVGFRHRIPQPEVLKDGLELSLVPDPTNEHDPDAVKIEAEGQTIGYVNRLQARSVAIWLSTRTVRCWLVRRNGRPDSPVAFAFLRMRLHQDLLAA